MCTCDTKSELFGQSTILHCVAKFDATASFGSFIRQGKYMSWVSFRVTDSEKEKINKKADDCAISRSSYCKQTALGTVPRSKYDLVVLNELTHLHADIGRVGGLLKMWLTHHEDIALHDKLDVQELVTEIRELKREIKDVVEKL